MRRIKKATKHFDRKTYKAEKWLNPNFHASSGSVVAFHGEKPWGDKRGIPYTYLRISDCNQTIQLHPTEFDSKKDYIKKLRLLQKEIGLFADFLDDVYL